MTSGPADERSKSVVTTFIQRPDLLAIHQATGDRAVDGSQAITAGGGSGHTKESS